MQAKHNISVGRIPSVGSPFYKLFKWKGGYKKNKGNFSKSLILANQAAELNRQVNQRASVCNGPRQTTRPSTMQAGEKEPEGVPCWITLKMNSSLLKQWTQYHQKCDQGGSGNHSGQFGELMWDEIATRSSLNGEGLRLEDEIKATDIYWTPGSVLHAL